MASLRAWLGSLVALSLLLSALRSLTPEGPLRKIAAFTGGLVLLSALLRPLTGGGLRMPEWDWDGDEAELAAWEAETRRAFGDRVAAGTAAAVEERAASMGLAVSAEAELFWRDGTPLPWAVTVYGSRNAALAQWIADALDIPPERQYWIPADAETDGAETAAEPED